MQMEIKKNIAAVFCCVTLLATCPLHAKDVLTVQSPVELQVCQRNKLDQASVVISGVIAAAADIIEAKADLPAAATRGKSVGWTPIAKGTEIANGKFTGKMSLKAGGWYAVSVRARRGKDVIGEFRIARVGVGEVFITAGQSNSANYGKPRQTARDSRVVYYNGKAFIPAKDPIPGGCGGGGSVWPPLGDHIAKSQQVPVCFRSASLTWTQVKNWMPPKTRLYTNLAKCAGEFGTGGVRAVLWHQGESDSLAKTSAETYCDRLKTIIESLNKDAGYEIPWFVAQASFHPGTKPPAEKEVAKGQQMLWEKGIAHKGPVTDDLLGKKYRSDGVHFNQLGLTTHAARWFKALTAEYKWKADSPARKEVFKIEGRPAFLILPTNVKAGRPIPWVWYAPTLRGLPGKHEKWMFDQFLDGGIAIAGVNVGESYGSPKGRAVYSALHKELVTKRGLAKQACLLARSRGGLMLYNWAVENPESVACITGIYPVCNLSSYPGLARACGAYGMTKEQLAAKLTEHNPIDRLAPLAKAKVPIFHIHGDRDSVVPLDKNSAELKKRYEKLGGKMTLEVVKGQGHNMWSGWFHSQRLVDFLISHAK
jgi:hypothetical protein